MEENEDLKASTPTQNPRNWKSYFKEFFMLFLAVFCGFLAENYRESLTVQKIEKEYMLSLIEDLKTDTSNLQTYIAFKKEKYYLMDSLAKMMLSEERNLYGNQMYYLARQIFNEVPFAYSDGSMQQLKNAGNLRLIKKRNIVDELLKYEKKARVLEEWDENDNKTKSTFREMGGRVSSSKEMNAALDANMRFVIPTTNPQLITDDFTTLNELSFQIHFLSKMSLGNSNRAESLRIDAAELLALIQTEYNLN
jgi:hypothetical protein